jgi:spore coat polysaccharide biosynthesis predicted glycosyltransferase SpsG
MRIAFRIDAGHAVGAGHFMRMSALGSAFEKLGHSYEFFTGENEPKDFSPFGVVVVDSYLATDEWISSLRSAERLLVCYDDNSLRNYDCDVFVNANLHAEELAFRFHGNPPLLLLGGKYALLRDEFQNTTPIEIRKTAKRILVCFGGSDPNEFTEFAVKALQSMEVEIVTVLGPYAKPSNSLKDLVYKNVRLLRDPVSMAEVMKSCDIALTGAGSMLYELASLGMPTLTISQADNQLLAASYFSRKGLAKNLGNWSSVSAKLIQDEVASLIADSERRSAESRRLISAVDRNGAMNAAIAILGALR